jgi:molybdopterin molybdotransferase
MLSVAEALHRVLEHAATLPPVEMALGEALGRVLAEAVASDVDSPPHDKSIVDGYAVRGSDLVDGRAALIVQEEIAAGNVPKLAVVPGCCARIMTGAPIPGSADSVVMIERTQLVASESGGRGQAHFCSEDCAKMSQSPLGTVHIHDDRFKTGQNVMPLGKSLRRGDVVLRPGVEITAAEVGLLAEVGRTQILTIPRPRVAILSTGNELVPASELPTAGQIRNSNGPLLAAAVSAAGGVPVDLGIARDHLDDLRRGIRAGLESDVLVISGGVSAGVLDLVPAVLTELNVEQVFHKINLKPGKPLWFGVHRASPLTPHPSSLNPRPSSLVFGLPGNPVSSLICFHLFVKPAMFRLAGRQQESLHATVAAKLTRPFDQHGDRPTYHPGKLVNSPEGALVELTNWHGSADLRGFVGANVLVIFPAGERRYQPVDAVDVLPL